LWTYYGTKNRIAKYYPKPEFDTIIEPFAGAAQYSLFGDNWHKNVYLIDKYEVIARVWQYLIDATEKDILALPDLEIGENVDDFKLLSDEEKWLMGFCINPASACPKKTTSKRSRWNKNKLEIAKNVYKVKHWKVKCDEFKNIKNIKATWYIDPPYKYGGIYYRMNNKNIDYQDLAEWCKTRNGQTIVCENTKADWLDFKPLVKMNGQLHQTMESIWCNVT
jgi:hypothetical protein